MNIWLGKNKYLLGLEVCSSRYIRSLHGIELVHDRMAWGQELTCLLVSMQLLGHLTRPVAGAWLVCFQMAQLIYRIGTYVHIYFYLICWSMADRICLFWNWHLTLLCQSKFSDLAHYVYVDHSKY